MISDRLSPMIMPQDNLTADYADNADSEIQSQKKRQEVSSRVCVAFMPFLIQFYFIRLNPRNPRFDSVHKPLFLTLSVES